MEYVKTCVGLPYWYGTFGQVATEELYNTKKAQYPSYYTDNDYTKQYGKKVHDCIGLIKAYLWQDENGVIKYNAAQDVSAAGMYSKSTTKGNITTMPLDAGILLYKGNTINTITHVGVYDGNGNVYEAKGHKYGVIETTYKQSDWQYWSLCPYIDYTEEIEEVEEITQSQFEEMYKTMVEKEQGDIHSDYAKKYIDLALVNKIVTGDGKGNYQWKQPVTKEQVITMIYLAIESLGYVID